MKTESGREIEKKETKWRRVKPEELIEELKNSQKDKNDGNKIGIDQKSVRINQQLHNSNSVTLTKPAKNLIKT